MAYWMAEKSLRCPASRTCCKHSLGVGEAIHREAPQLETDHEITQGGAGRSCWPAGCFRLLKLGSGEPHRGKERRAESGPEPGRENPSSVLSTTYITSCQMEKEKYL